MVNKVIQAVAGSGKTYYGTHELIKERRCLYLTFTNGNVKNINLELRNAKNNIENCEIMTFSKFVCSWLVRPFFPNLFPKLDIFNGYTTIKPPEHSRNKNNGYVKKDFKRHYVDSKGRLYLNRVSELIINQKKQILNLMFKRIKRFVDLIIIDEYQDLTGKDFDLLKLLMKQSDFEVILTGDIFQAGVSSSSLKKRSKLLDYKKETEEMDDFIKKAFGIKRIEVVLDMLPNSRRISTDCARFISDRIGINIGSSSNSNSSVHLIRDIGQLENIMKNRLTVLIYNKSIVHKFRNEDYNSWSYVKGNTCENVLVVLTKKTDSILDGVLDLNTTPQVRNMLYVALTRAKGDLYVVKSTTWKKANSTIS